MQRFGRRSRQFSTISSTMTDLTGQSSSDLHGTTQELTARSTRQAEAAELVCDFLQKQTTEQTQDLTLLAIFLNRSNKNILKSHILIFGLLLGRLLLRLWVALRVSGAEVARIFLMNQNALLKVDSLMQLVEQIIFVQCSTVWVSAIRRSLLSLVVTFSEDVILIEVVSKDLGYAHLPHSPMIISGNFLRLNGQSRNGMDLSNMKIQGET
mmetsp:Transcript_13208/g.19742  ORF Transcript_13208/g.19742 Transcript_13208/m.19742 type:complete len:210 (-) Transcript_13208:381-1010(-)